MARDNRPQRRNNEEKEAYDEFMSKAPLCKGSSRKSRVRDCLAFKFCIYNPSVATSCATSPYTEEAFI